MVDPNAMAWSMEDWQWDPFTLKAMPTEKASGKPQCTGTPAPELAPSLDLSSVSTQLVEDAHQASGKGKGRPQCQVEGCSGDLTALKEYHQRYKICEYHMKVRATPATSAALAGPRVVLPQQLNQGFAAADGPAVRRAQVNSIVCDGRRQRFCQQCGRFHDLAAFDGDKRSCRARLQRHNARRRKQADTADSARASSSLARLRGGRVAAKKGPREDETVDYARPASSRQKQAHGSCIKVRRCSACVRACLLCV